MDGIAKANKKLQAQSASLSQRIRSLDIPTGPQQTQPQSQQSSGSRRGSSFDVKFGFTLPSNAAVSDSKSIASAIPVSQKTLSHRLFQLIDYLKKCETPQTVEEIWQGAEVDLTDSVLFNAVSKNPKVLYQDGKLSYKPTYNVRNKDDLLVLIENHWKKGHGGLHVKDLKDTWRGIGQAILELEEANRVILFRKKDGKPNVLFYNQLPSQQLNENPEFQQLWQQFPLPDQTDVQREMSTAGLSVIEIQQEKNDKADEESADKKKKKRRARHIKITNTHLKDIDLTVDYPMAKKQ